MPNDEIAEFLRRAQQRREEQMRKQAAPTPSMPMPQTQAPPPPPRLSQPRLEELDNPYEPVVAEAMPAPVPVPRQSPFQPPPQIGLPQGRAPQPRAPQARAPQPVNRPARSIQPVQPSRRVADVDRETAARLQGKFDHTLGQDLGVAQHDASGHTTAASVAPVSAIVKRVQTMMQSPEDIRAAMIVAEILKRPEL